jgi:hypothetical protein
MQNMNVETNTIEAVETNTVDTVETPTAQKSNRGRKAAFADKFAVVAALKSIGSEAQPSRYLIAQLIDRGFVEYQKVGNEGRRGRPEQKAVVTGKGRSYVALSARW